MASFIALPRELRNKIYACHFSAKSFIVFGEPRWMDAPDPTRRLQLMPQFFDLPEGRQTSERKADIGILLASRTIHDEAETVMYETVTFVYAIDTASRLERDAILQVASDCRMKNLKISVDMMDWSGIISYATNELRMNLICDRVMPLIQKILLPHVTSPSHVKRSLVLSLWYIGADLSGLPFLLKPLRLLSSFERVEIDFSSECKYVLPRQDFPPREEFQIRQDWLRDEWIFQEHPDVTYTTQIRMVNGRPCTFPVHETEEYDAFPDARALRKMNRLLEKHINMAKDYLEGLLGPWEEGGQNDVFTRYVVYRPREQRAAGLAARTERSLEVLLL